MNRGGRGWHRGGAAPGPDVRELANWRALIKAAGEVADRPAADRFGAMVRTANAKLIRGPIGHQDSASVFFALRALARTWPALSLEGRLRQVEELVRLAEACAEILDPPRGDLPSNDYVRAPPRRVDIED